MNISRRLYGVLSIAACLCCSILSIWFSYDHYYSKELVSLKMGLPWIQSMGINLSFGIDPVCALIAPILIISMLYCLLISKLDEEKDSLYFIYMMALMVGASGFIISRNIAIKILFWEICWVPIFFIMIGEGKKSIAAHFSIIWFISELMMISGLVLLYTQMGQNHQIEKLSALRNSDLNTEIIFWLFMSGIVLRSMLLPFNKLLAKIIEELPSSFSSMISVLMPSLSLVFMVQVIIPIFQIQLNTYNIYLSTSLIIIAGINLIGFIKEKTVYSVINAQIIVFTSIMLACLAAIDRTSITGAIEMMTLKLPLNLLIVSCGVMAARHEMKIKSVYTWIFVSAILLSFGIPGLSLFGPIFKVVGFWNTQQLWLGISICTILAALLVITSFIISKEMDMNNRSDHALSYPAVITAVIIMIISILAASSYSPMKDMSDNYFKGISGDMY